MTGYQRPVTDPVSSSWADHKYRDPPSSEPGTDYACAYGTWILAADSGVIIDLQTGNGGGTGRYVTIGLDDGNTVRYLHLSEIAVGLGTRVARGDAIAISGASGYGNDWHYGPHVHTTLWIGPAWESPTVDFDTYVGEPPPPAVARLDDEMPQFFEPNVIVWANGWANSYDAQVYAAMKSYANDPNNPSTQWVRDTWVRESWAAVEGIQKRQSDVIAVADASAAATERRWSVGLVVAIVLGLAADVPLILIAVALLSQRV